MNILDVNNIDVPAAAKLEHIFNRQLELLNKYIPIEKKNGRLFPVDKPPLKEYDSPLVQDFIKQEIMRIIVELIEAADCLKNKYWKNTHMETDVTHFIEELIDAFHFFIELLIWLGIGPYELYLFYMKKSEVNKFRQVSNY